MEGVEVVHLEDSSHNSQSEHYPLERSNSCSGAFRRGLSSLAMRRQLSAFSDTVDQHFTGSVLANYTVESDSSLLNTEKMTTVPSGYADFACHRDANGLSKSPATVIEPDSVCSIFHTIMNTEILKAFQHTHCTSALRNLAVAEDNSGTHKNVRCVDLCFDS
ncbi:hypothetical protein Tcan_02180 [Toxocara canis]|uniref:Uncharacterized protein n=1 Tax=Toxocara canis TaxID=6265 RepID=A0A0B2UKG7_TOXCA|nr:hypothetical protein Tcan_02180 [Toxocara canis]